MIIAQISDPHVTDSATGTVPGLDATARLARVVAEVSALRPVVDGVVISGDLVERGAIAEYEILAGVLAALRVPYWLMVGNHDDRDALRAIFPNVDAGPVPNRLCGCTEVDGLRLLMLDSLLPGKTSGLLDAVQLGWLDNLLAAATTPAMVFVHHPPPTTALPHVDRSALVNADELAAVLRRHAHVVRVACGHLHRTMVANWAGTTLSACPSTAHGFSLDLDPAGRMVAEAAPAGYQLHRWQGGVLHTYTKHLD